MRGWRRRWRRGGWGCRGWEGGGGLGGGEDWCWRGREEEGTSAAEIGLCLLLQGTRGSGSLHAKGGGGGVQKKEIYVDTFIFSDLQH